MRKYSEMSREERELLKSLAVFLGLKAAIYIFIAWSSRWARNLDK